MERRILTVSIARFADSVGSGMAYFALPILISSLSVYSLPIDLVSGIVISIWGLVATLVQPLAGKVIERSSRPKKILSLSLLLTAILIFFYTSIRTVEELLFLRVVLGIIESFLMVSSLTLVISLAGKKKGQSFGIYNTFTDLGFSISPIMAGILISLNLNIVFYISALFVLVSSMGVFMLVDEPEISEMKKRKGGFRDVSREIYPILVSLMFVVALMSSIVPLENSFLERLSITPLEFGLSFSIYLITRTLSNTYAGYLTDRHGGLKSYTISSLLISVTSLLILIPNIYVFLGVRFIQGFIVALVYTSATVTIAERSGLSYAMSMSILSSVITAGLTAGPLIAGMMSGYVGFESPYILFSLLISVPVVLQTLKNKRGQFQPLKS
ncbi:MFS transporter [Geoglobus acetivorans]|uniref:MFS transporter n=1 Tax=Geoglobus acetivorans TaxID=565033 RepID=A0ABZ3H2U1_GEOAI|nr:MFS transporter [Geoglobus acetivorans]